MLFASNNQFSKDSNNIQLFVEKCAAATLSLWKKQKPKKKEKEKEKSK